MIKQPDTPRRQSTLPKTPVTVITGFLGSGKTTLLRHLLKHSHKKLAIVMNEFGEVAIDSKLIKGKNINVAELTGGCVCCSLSGEFEAAVKELIEKYHPEQIVVETTGVAEPDALALDIQSMSMLRLDAVVCIADAEAIIKYPKLGHTTQKQIEMADLILVNKIDLIDRKDSVIVGKKLKVINKEAEIIPVINCKIEPSLVLGLEITGKEIKKEKTHILDDYSSYVYKGRAMDLDKAVQFITNTDVWRVKGFINAGKETHFLNCVNGRCTMELWNKKSATQLVFIDKKLDNKIIEQNMKKCELS